MTGSRGGRRFRNRISAGNFGLKVCRLQVDTGAADFHVSFGIRLWGESHGRVEAVGIAGHQLEPSNFLKLWVGQDGSDEPFSQALSAVRLYDEYVAQVGVGCEVGNHPSETHLFGLVVEAEAEGILQGLSHAIDADALCPVAVGQKLVNDTGIEPGWIRRNGVVPNRFLKNLMIHGN
jgi:hypothetical protein